MMMVACGRPRNSASSTPVWPKPWSSLCRPVRIRSKFSASMAAASERAEAERIELEEIGVGDVDAAVGAFGECFLDGLLGALGAHGDSTTSPPCFSFRRRASSSAKLSGSLVSKPMSDSRIQAPPSRMARGASFAGTCFTQTPIFKNASEQWTMRTI